MSVSPSAYPCNSFQPELVFQALIRSVWLFGKADRRLPRLLGEQITACTRILFRMPILNISSSHLMRLIYPWGSDVNHVYLRNSCSRIGNLRDFSIAGMRRTIARVRRPASAGTVAVIPHTVSFASISGRCSAPSNDGSQNRPRCSPISCERNPAPSNPARLHKAGRIYASTWLGLCETRYPDKNDRFLVQPAGQPSHE